MPNLIKCGRKYINLDNVDAINDEYYHNATLVRVLFNGADDWTTFRISDEELKDFQASLDKYTN